MIMANGKILTSLCNWEIAHLPSQRTLGTQSLGKQEEGHIKQDEFKKELLKEML